MNRGVPVRGVGLRGKENALPDMVCSCGERARRLERRVMHGVDAGALNGPNGRALRAAFARRAVSILEELGHRRYGGRRVFGRGIRVKRNGIHVYG